MNNNYNDDNNTSGGERSRFKDRLNKINKQKKRINNEIDKDEIFIIRLFRNIFKVTLALPSIIYTVIKDKNISNTSNHIDLVNKKNDNFNNNVDLLTYEQKQKNKRIKVNKIKSIDVSLMKNMVNYSGSYNTVYSKDEICEKKNNTKTSDYIDISDNSKNNNLDNNIKDVNNNQKEVSIGESLLKEQKINKLQKEIINLIKKKLVKTINELEILYSELYLLNELNIGDVYLNDVKDDIKEIKKLLSKVKALKEKYDFLKENVDFEYMLEYEDDLLADKILELKSLCSSNDIKYVVDNYKILDEYKYLYLKIDKLETNMNTYYDNRNEKVLELKKRDIDFDKLVNDVYDVDKENTRYENFVREQELFLNELNNKIAKIDSREDVTYRLKGFNQLLGNSFKYLGLLLLSPFKGFLPGIATQTLVTKNVIKNLYKNLEWEEDRKTVYEAIDYSNEIHNAINNLDFTALMIDSTLDDISRLKEKYNKEFEKYGSSISSYKDTIKKLNKIQNSVFSAKIKVEIMQVKMKEKEKENNNKLKMVKKLNTSNNN